MYSHASVSLSCYLSIKTLTDYVFATTEYQTLIFFLFSFLVEACEYLEEYIHTEGLFRKSGSVVRLKALKVTPFPLYFLK